MLTGHEGPDQRCCCRSGEIDGAVAERRREFGIVAARSKRIGEDFDCIWKPGRLTVTPPYTLSAASQDAVAGCRRTFTAPGLAPRESNISLKRGGATLAVNMRPTYTPQRLTVLSSWNRCGSRAIRSFEQ